MDYSVPTTGDLADVYSLNSALLKAMRGPQGDGLRQYLPVSCQPLIRALSDLQLERLARTPFLLFTLHEQDSSYWRRLLEDDPRRDLFAVNDRSFDGYSQLVAGAIGFAWQLVKRDRYVARLVCGASLEWCENLASLPLIEVLARVADRVDLLLPRQAECEDFWRRLLSGGISGDCNLRNAAQLSALQIILTGLDDRRRRRLPSAACRAAVPIMNM